jgi:putative peptidoglycan lipid II flippase
MRYFLLLAFMLASLGTAMWVFLSDWIVSVIYASGEFSNTDSDLVASVQRAFVLQIPFYVIGIFCWRMFNALEEWKPLLFATLPALVVNAAVATPLGSEYQATGIAAGYTLSIAVWALILLITLRRKLTALPGQTIQPGKLPIH